MSDEQANITWDEHGQPYSQTFGDVYFSKDNGLEESRYVFLEQNRICDRFSQLNNNVFVVAETGFGTGLNFLLTWQAWKQKCTNSRAQLHFISVEKYPLSKPDLRHALALWPELEDFANELVQAYPPQPLKGTQRFTFDQGAVRLTLFFGEAHEGFSQFINHADNSSVGNTPWCVDAWYLDGFAPAKNPEMWTPDLFQAIAKLSDKATTFSTFTAAGSVRRGLIEVGFECEKIPGFGRKREMLKGQLAATPPPSNAEWPMVVSSLRPKRLAIIGGGIAACTAANALAKRGMEVRLFEKNSQLAMESSGNRQGVLYTRLSPHDSPLNHFNLNTQIFANRYYSEKNLFSTCGDQCGVLHLALSEKEERYYRALDQRYRATGFAQWLNADDASSVAGVKVNAGGLFIQEAGWLHPKSVCESLVAEPNIEMVFNTTISDLRHDGHWKLFDQHQQLVSDADAVVIACAHSARLLAQAEHLPLKTIRGQVTHLPRACHQTNRVVVCGDGYIAPADEDLQCVGATFNLTDKDIAVRQEDHQTNLDNLQKMLVLQNDIPVAQLEGRVGFRCSTPDYFPITGPLADAAAFVREFDILRKKAKANPQRPGCYHPGLYSNLAFGSRGLAYAPLCAEALASVICGEPLPLDYALYKHVHPARFLVRDLIRNNLG